MRVPPPREQGSEERVPSRRPADVPAPEGAALVEHVVDKLARTERELNQARDAAAAGERERALLRSAARLVASSEGVDPTEVVRSFLPTLGHWCLIDQITNGHADRRLAASDSALEQRARSVEGELALDGDASLGLVRALRRRRAERLEHVSLSRPSGHREGEQEEAGVAALELLVAGPVLVVPISARGRIIGALSFGRSADQSVFDDRDQRLAEDLAQLVAMAIEHRRITSAAEAASRTKSDFLAMMSHELRTPLNAIAGYAQLLEMGFRGSLTEGQRDAVNRILRGQEHLLTLVDGVLTFSRLTSGRLAIDSTELDAADLIDLASEPLVVQFAAGEINFRILPFPERARVCADRERAVDILRHLLSNALKFTPRGGSIKVALAQAGPNQVEFSVADTGPGVPSNMRTQIFEKFRQLESTSNRSGFGLGLNICAKIVKLHRGLIWVDSEPGMGSRFTLRIPIRQEGGYNVTSKSS